MGFDLSQLGIVQNLPSINFVDYTGLFMAPPKFGKSTTASKFPGALIVPFEKGEKGLVANVLENINSWDDFVEFIDKLEEHRDQIGNSIQTIVFDTINVAYDMLEPYTLRYCSRIDGIKYKTVSDMQGAKSNFWVERDRLLKKELTRILNLGFSMLFITHLKVKTIKPKKADPYDVYSSTMSDRLEAIIYPLVDFILTGENRKIEENGGLVNKRVLVTSSNEMSTAGARVFINEDIYFDTEEEAMAKYQDAFKKMIQEKLNKAGITENIDKLAKQQLKEKEAKVKDYIQKSKLLSNDELVEVIKEKYPSVNEEQKNTIQVIMEQYDIKNFKDADKLNNEGLQKIVEVLNN